MFSFIYDYFLKRISFNDEIIEKIKLLSEVNWLANLGNETDDINCKYNISPVKSGNDALRYLQYKKKYKGIIPLSELLSEGSNRSAGYLSKYRQREFDTEWNEVSKKADKYINFAHLLESELTFNKKYNSNINLHLIEYIYDYIHCLYFKKNDPEFPTFALDVFDIYKKGHLIVAWQGKFNSMYDEKISPKEGNILIW